MTTDASFGLFFDGPRKLREISMPTLLFTSDRRIGWIEYSRDVSRADRKRGVPHKILRIPREPRHYLHPSVKIIRAVYLKMVDHALDGLVQDSIIFALDFPLITEARVLG